MSEDSKTAGRSHNLARTACEWGTMVFALLSVACLFYWFASLMWPTLDMTPLQPGYRLAVTTAGGSITMSSNLDWTIESLDQLANSRGLNPPLDSDRGLGLPGFRYRALRFTDADYSDWALEISFLILSLAWGAIAAACYFGHRAIQRRKVTNNG